MIMAERQVSALFDKVPKNQSFPDDIFLLKEIKDKENHIHFAPSIVIHSGDGSGIGEKELEEMVALRSASMGSEYRVDISARNNSYMPVAGRKVRLYYAPKEAAGNKDSWKPLKTLSGMAETEIERVFPFQDGYTRESFVVTPESNAYYLIAALDEEFSATKLPDNPVDLGQLNESYYWCILDSEEMMG